MKKLRFALHALAFALAVAIPAQAETVSQGVFKIGEQDFRFYPFGFMSGTMQPRLYKMVDSDFPEDGDDYWNTTQDEWMLINYKYGYISAPGAVFCGPAYYLDHNAVLQGDVTVPDFIVGGNVIGIDNAFRNSLCGNVAMPDDLGRIEEESFKGSSHLKKLTFPSGLVFLGKEALAEMDALEEITFRGAFPPACNVQLLSLIHI